MDFGDISNFGNLSASAVVFLIVLRMIFAQNDKRYSELADIIKKLLENEKND